MKKSISFVLEKSSNIPPKSCLQSTRDISRPCSHWSSSYTTGLSLVERLIVMKYLQESGLRVPLSFQVSPPSQSPLEARGEALLRPGGGRGGPGSGRSWRKHPREIRLHQRCLLKLVGSLISYYNDAFLSLVYYLSLRDEMDSLFTPQNKIIAHFF